MEMLANASLDVSAASHAIPTAPYERQRPSPPFIPVPHGIQYDTGRINLMPSYENIDPTQLRSGDLEIITQNKVQVAKDRTLAWTYEQRRAAQPILDFLYLGPTSVIRDQDYLRREGITMILIARHTSLASQRLLSVERVSESLGIPVKYVDVESDYLLIRGFPEAIRIINDHLLAVYHSQAQGRNKAGQLLVEADNFQRGKVLLACDSGNDRSAALAAAYIMAVFGSDMWSAINFITVQRFCCTFTEEIKRVLLTWEDMLKARSAVAIATHGRGSGSGSGETQQRANSKGKRDLDDMMETDGDGDVSEPTVPDRDRFVGRDDFAPFLDG